MKLLFALLLFVIAMPAFATENRYVEEDGNAITLCRGALPGWETNLRSRPLALVNEGNTASFVNCGWRAPTNSNGQTFVEVVLANFTGSPVAVRCLGIVGIEDGGADYRPKTTEIPAHGYAMVRWSGEMKTNTSAQCLLPPGVGIARTPQGYWQR